MTAVNADEIKALESADGYAEEALEAVLAAPREKAVVYALLSLGAQVAALRETLNRELSDIGAAIVEARQD